MAPRVLSARSWPRKFKHYHDRFHRGHRRIEVVSDDGHAETIIFYRMNRIGDVLPLEDKVRVDIPDFDPQAFKLLKRRQIAFRATELAIYRANPSVPRDEYSRPGFSGRDVIEFLLTCRDDDDEWCKTQGTTPDEIRDEDWVSPAFDYDRRIPLFIPWSPGFPS